MNLDVDAVNALAPDASSAAAARNLAAPAHWPTLGANDQAVWGECQGSGAKPYQTQVDIAGSSPVFRCSCPSRKFPCKHGLALMLLRAKQAALFAQSAAPAWVGEWLASREKKERQKQQRAKDAASSSATAATDATAARDTKRAAQRWSRIQTAANDLQAWLSDRIAQGLGILNEEHRNDWNVMAARLVDAQAPGLALRLREAALCIRRGADWPEQLLHRLGLLHLVCAALSRRERWPSDLQAELRTVAGWPYDMADVLEQGEHVVDHWTVLGQAREEIEDKLLERRVWLHGEHSGRYALLLDHAYGGQGYEQVWLGGSRIAATMVFFPGVSKLRALAVDSVALPMPAVWPVSSFDAEWRKIAKRVADSPWVRFHPMVVSAAIPAYKDGNLFIVIDGRALPLESNGADLWSLLAYSGGHPVEMMGEWDGQVLHPLIVWSSAGVWQRSSN